ncbi:MAG: PilZ domain-containing protein [Gammaproteobacteria bacterium]|nr:PilZ domain-containing protein [Gammaproteobacteria bacterium]NVK87631.1 PilZ domain-containing protein [Gammaproteobacteria bacterium]
MNERRDQLRHRRKRRVSLEWSYNDDTGALNRIDCETLDISRQGMRIKSKTPLDPGSSVQLCVESATGQLWLLFAKLIWCQLQEDGFECGLTITSDGHDDFPHWARELDLLKSAAEDQKVQ